MKQITWNLLAALAILIPSGCSTSELEDNSQEILPTLGVSSAKLETKSIYTGLGNGADAYTLSTVGVVVLRANKNAYYDPDVTKQVFKANNADGSGGWDLDGGSNPLYLLDAQGTVFGFAPSTETPTFSSGEAPKLAVTQNAAMQFGFTTDGTNTDWEVDQTDYLYSSTQSTVSKASITAALAMEHAMSKISFRVMKADGLPAPGDRDYVKKVELEYVKDGSDKNGFAGGSTDVKLDLSSGDMTVGADNQVTSLTMAPATIANARQVVANAVSYDNVLPQAFGLVVPFPTDSKAKFKVKVTVGTKDADATYDRVFTTTGTAATLNWEKGNHYIYTIEITDKTLSITGVTLAGWNDQTVSLPVE